MAYERETWLALASDLRSCDLTGFWGRYRDYLVRSSVDSGQRAILVQAAGETFARLKKTPDQQVAELAGLLRELHDFAVPSEHHRDQERSRLAFSRAAEWLKRNGF